MSKLADKIRAAMRLQPQTVGFGPQRSAKATTLVLAAVARDAREAADVARKGADVVVLGAPGSPAPKDGLKDTKDVIAGACIAGKAANEAAAYREGGYDFVVFDPGSTSASALLDDKVGYVMILPRDLSEIETRALDAFRLDAIDVGELNGSLTVRRQIELQRIAAVTRKPLMASVPADIPVPELQALRDAGVAVVGTGAKGIEQLRKTIDELPPRSRRDERDRPTAIVSHHALSQEHDDDDG